MHIADAVRTIAEFWEGLPLPWVGGGMAHVEMLQREFSQAFSDELLTHIRHFAPRHRFELWTIGNPIALYGLEGDRRLGYSRHGLTGERLEGWQPAWFLLADEGADPIVVDLSRGDAQIRQALHGAGAWNFRPVADTIGQFVLCAAARHHALAKWSGQLRDEASGYNLPSEGAAWLFPRMRDWSGDYYGGWCEDFANA
jgi:hypothetical protein